LRHQLSLQINLLKAYYNVEYNSNSKYNINIIKYNMNIIKYNIDIIKYNMNIIKHNINIIKYINTAK